MKKTLLTALVAGLFVAAVAAVPAWSQTRFSLNLGAQTNIYEGTSFDNAWFTLDVRVGIGLGKSFEISPEIMYAVDDSFDFNYGMLFPGVLVNYKSSGFFVGGGLLLPVFFYEGGSDTASISPKINLGYDFGKLKLTAYFLSILDSGLSLFDMNQAGVTLGLRF